MEELLKVNDISMVFGGLRAVSNFYVSLGADEADQARHLFAALRQLDELGAKEVYARCPDKEGVGLAVYNRLIRAAAYHELPVEQE